MPAEGNGARPSIFERARRALRGTDRAGVPALPLGEALHPAALAAIALLAVNDWLLKPRLGPGVVTGKLSDLAGLAFAPVVLSAAIGLALRLATSLGARIDPSLSRRRLIACIAATGAVFAAVKLDPAAAHAVAALIGRLGRPAAIALDRTDLLCLPALAVAWWIGRDELRRVPLGRPAAIHRLGRPAAAALADVGRAGAPPARVAALAAAIDAWNVAAIDRLLAGYDANR
ncbi:MAG TPA: hypothetical protein VK601_00010 [Kofleriaceae bacterium]|nr:hypothetical protein [Kofleriaceae bacterium]